MDFIFLMLFQCGHIFLCPSLKVKLVLTKRPRLMIWDSARYASNMETPHHRFVTSKCKSVFVRKKLVNQNISIIFPILKEAGRLLYLGQNEWAHINCCLWSAEVYEDNSALLQVHSAVSRGRHLVRDAIFSSHVNLWEDLHIYNTHPVSGLSALWPLRPIGSHRRLLPHHLPEQLPLHVRTCPELRVSAGPEGVLL